MTTQFVRLTSGNRGYPILWFAALILFFLGCATPPQRAYQGPELPAAKTATVTTDSPYVTLRDVDGVKTISTVKYLTYFSYPKSIYLSPGIHDITIRYKCADKLLNEKFQLVASAGQTYVVKANPICYGIEFWIEEQESGEIVSGTRNKGYREKCGSSCQ